MQVMKAWLKSRLTVVACEVPCLQSSMPRTMLAEAPYVSWVLLLLSVTWETSSGEVLLPRIADGFIDREGSSSHHQNVARVSFTFCCQVCCGCRVEKSLDTGVHPFWFRELFSAIIEQVCDEISFIGQVCWMTCQRLQHYWFRPSA